MYKNTEIVYGEKFEFCKNIISDDFIENFPEISINLFLNGALLFKFCNDKNTEKISINFLQKSIQIFENEIANFHTKYEILAFFVGCLEQILPGFAYENRIFYTKIAIQNSVKLLRKSDQIKGILICSHLFWSNSYVFLEIYSHHKISKKKNLLMKFLKNQ